YAHLEPGEVCRGGPEPVDGSPRRGGVAQDDRVIHGCGGGARGDYLGALDGRNGTNAAAVPWGGVRARRSGVVAASLAPTTAVSGRAVPARSARRVGARARAWSGSPPSR